jgi:ATPase subunit of ABC transporter with duplicated ATPase domains
LSEALSQWGEDDGAVVVISHDKAFCDKVGFTHVATVHNGGLKLEQRGTRGSDWDSSIATFQRTNEVDDGPSTTTNSGEEESKKELDPEQRKQAYNAPKRIAKIENLVVEAESKIAVIDDEMMTVGNDVGKLVDMSKEKEKLEEKVMELMEEWEELEVLLTQLA